MGYSWGYQILAMDMEGITWSCGSTGSIHQAQSHLCVCTICGHNMPKLNIWILEDFGTNEWTLKHKRLTLNLVTGMLVSTTKWFTQNGICFCLMGLGRKMTSSHITWAAEKFMSSLHIIVRFSNGMSYHKTSADLTIFPMFPYSRSWSH
jgi:hypothetical protein